MKKMMKTMLLVLLIGAMLSTSALAAGEEVPTVTPITDGTVETAFDSSNVKLPTLTYQNENIVANGQYMIFVVTGNDGEYMPSADSILYINQVQATEDGTVTFENVYPKTVQNSAVMISGTGFSVPQVIAEIELPEVLLGFITDDENITTADAQEILKYAAGVESVIQKAELSSWLKRADINSDGRITASDAQEVLRYAVGLSSALDTVYSK